MSEIESSAAGGVAAVDRAFAIIEALTTSGNPMPLADLARATGLYKSTILRLIISLERAAIVVRRHDDKYELGPLAFRLGRAYDMNLQMQDRVRSTLELLVAKGTESASFHTPYDDSYRLCLLRVNSAHPTLDSVQQGDLLPADRGAPAEVIKRFSRCSNNQYSHKQYSGKQDSNKQCKDKQSVSASDLLSTSFGARDKACGAIACPVFAAGDRFIGALSLSGPQERFTEEAVAQMSTLLLQEARSLSSVLGGHWPVDG